MTLLPIILYSISALGLVALILCIVNLVAPFTGWRCAYNASAAQQMTVEIPKAGAYSVCLSRNRFWLLNGGSIAFSPQIDFSVTGAYSSEPIPCYREFGVRSTGVSKVSMPVGYFVVQEPGSYVVTHQCNNPFADDDEILIRKRLPVGKFILLILGIVAGSMALLGGGIAGTLILFHIF